MLRDVEVLCSQAMPDRGIVHGFLGRTGGVSEGPFRSLNCGLGSKDKHEHVTENRRRALAATGLGDAPLVTPKQIHSARVHVVTTAPAQLDPGDAVVTRTPGIAIGILTADCAPVLLADPEARVVGAAHAGWRGALAGVVQETVSAMVRIGARRQHITAAVGPAIAQPSYEVDPPFADPFIESDPLHRSLFRSAGEKLLFNLSGYVVGCLMQAGVCNVDTFEADTAGEPDRFFSFRRSHREGETRYGRLLSIIGLN